MKKTRVTEEELIDQKWRIWMSVSKGNLSRQREDSLPVSDGCGTIGQRGSVFKWSDFLWYIPPALRHLRTHGLRV